jgi:sugar phosphate isomerase/epimerase
MTSVESGVILWPTVDENRQATLETIKQAGVDCLELWLGDQCLDARDLSGILRLGERIRRTGLRPYTVHAPWGDQLEPSAADPEHRAAWLAVSTAAAALLRATGGRIVIVHPSPKITDDERPVRLKRCVEMMARLAQRCAELGVVVAVENMLPAHLGDRAEELQAMVDPLPRDVVGYCFDTGHAHVCPEGMAIGEAMGDRIVTLHLHDNQGQSDEHLLPFSGSLDWARVAQVLDAAQYHGPYIIESAKPSREEVAQNAPGLAARLHALRDGSAGPA